MERMIDLKEISDGRLYTAEDMVKADCQDCKGCSACCRGMGSSIILDPYDIYQLELGLHLSFEKLLAGYLELNVVEGMYFQISVLMARRRNASSTMTMGAAASTSFAPASAAFSRWDVSTRTGVFAITCRSTNVRRRTGARSK